MWLTCKFSSCMPRITVSSVSWATCVLTKTGCEPHGRHALPESSSLSRSPMKALSAQPATSTCSGWSSKAMYSYIWTAQVCCIQATAGIKTELSTEGRHYTLFSCLVSRDMSCFVPATHICAAFSHTAATLAHRSAALAAFSHVQVANCCHSLLGSCS